MDTNKSCANFNNKIKNLKSLKKAILLHFLNNYFKKMCVHPKSSSKIKCSYNNCKNNVNDNDAVIL